MPERIQLSRAKGWRMPENTVNVARPGPWGNPFVIGAPGVPDAAAAVAKYREWMVGVLTPGHPGELHTRIALNELRGKNLACWCKPGEPCHADVLLALVLANEP